jgi:hypothetical protein
MKQYLGYTCSAVIVAGVVLAGFAASEDKRAQKLDPKMEEMMKKAEEAGTPGAAHKALEPLIGNWNAEVKCWMGPDAPPMMTKGTAKATWAMNKRFVQEEFTGEFMGKPFRGMSLTGYDNIKEKYNSVWVDDMHTSIFTSEGPAENDAKVITLTGKMDCPLTGEKEVPMKQVLRILSPDKHVFEMHDPRQGANSKTMEITYTRK